MARKVARTSTWSVRVLTTPTLLLDRNDDRASYYIINQHANLAIYVASGTSNGPHVAVAGQHVGERIGPNGGNIFDNDDVDSVYGVSTAVNADVLVIEKVYAAQVTRGVNR